MLWRRTHPKLLDLVDMQELVAGKWKTESFWKAEVCLSLREREQSGTTRVNVGKNAVTRIHVDIEMADELTCRQRFVVFVQDDKVHTFRPDEFFRLCCVNQVRIGAFVVRCCHH